MDLHSALGQWSSFGCRLPASLLPSLSLSVYMFVYCEPLDIDLSYYSFEVGSHSSAGSFDALAIALKSQLESWDRHWLDAERFDQGFFFISLINVDSETTAQE